MDCLAFVVTLMCVLCSDPFISALFFGAFTVIAQFVLLNVVIAVLMAQVKHPTNDEQTS